MSGVVRRLDAICIHRYLLCLEQAIRAFLSLVVADSVYLNRVRDRMVPLLKEQLDQYLSGTCSSSIRNEMMCWIFSGQFPTHRSKASYVKDRRYDENAIKSEEDRDIMDKIKEHGSQCCGTCCSAAFIVETMACIVINDEIREINFNFSAKSKFWDDRVLKKYVQLHLPGIISHLYVSLRKNYKLRKPKLERLIIYNTGLTAREYTIAEYNSTVMNAYRETREFYKLTHAITETALGKQKLGHFRTLPFSDDLFAGVCDMFNMGVARFDRLTEIIFGIELTSSALNIKYRPGELVSVRLFSGIGKSCPNLRTLDCSESLNIPNEAFIHLLLYDAYETLHKYAYIPTHTVDRITGGFALEMLSDPYEVKKHSNDRFCPWCWDYSEQTPCKDGTKFAAIPTPIVDDRLYAFIENVYVNYAPLYLINVVKASDLVKSLGDDKEASVEYVEYVEMPEPELGSLKEEKERLKAAEQELEDVDESHRPDRFPVPANRPRLNPICRNLQILKLGHLGPGYEIVPFLLKAVPRVKSLGSVNVLNGLNMMHKVEALQGAVSTSGLEEITLDVVGNEYKLAGTQWANLEIRNEVADFLSLLDNPTRTRKEMRSRLCDDLKLVTRHFPDLRSLNVFLYLEEHPTLLRTEHEWIWSPLVDLPHLHELRIQGCSEFSQITALFKVIGERLGRLLLSMEGGLRRIDSPTEFIEKVPTLDTLLTMFPRLNTLKVEMRMAPIQLALNVALHDLSNLRKVSLGLYVSQKCFEWLWRLSPNLEEILIPTVCGRPISDLAQFFNRPSYQVYYTKEMLVYLFTCNSMREMRKMRAHLCMDDIEAANYLIETLRFNTRNEVEEIGKLTIRVKLSRERYNDQEEMHREAFQLLTQMKRFKMECDALRHAETPTKVSYSWERAGIFQKYVEPPRRLDWLQPL